MYYTIGEMARRLNVAPSTLRYYDREGLLPFVERSDGGIRRFKESDMEWLRIIECLKCTGMPIREIKVFIDWCVAGDATIGNRLALIEKQRQNVKRQIEELQTHLRLLDYKRWYYETAQAAGSCSIHEGPDAAPVPEEFREIVECCEDSLP
ncbi:MAG: MerR family transcriptional regulator [Clostridia bacterium]|nr:MerR family transcriptional regulator [Clostridia bacterium]